MASGVRNIAYQGQQALSAFHLFNANSKRVAAAEAKLDELAGQGDFYSAVDRLADATASPDTEVRLKQYQVLFERLESLSPEAGMVPGLAGVALLLLRQRPDPQPAAALKIVAEASGDPLVAQFQNTQDPMAALSFLVDPSRQSLKQPALADLAVDQRLAQLGDDDRKLLLDLRSAGADGASLLHGLEQKSPLAVARAVFHTSQASVQDKLAPVCLARLAPAWREVFKSLAGLAPQEALLERALELADRKVELGSDPDTAVIGQLLARIGQREPHNRERAWQATSVAMAELSQDHPNPARFLSTLLSKSYMWRDGLAAAADGLDLLQNGGLALDYCRAADQALASGDQGERLRFLQSMFELLADNPNPGLPEMVQATRHLTKEKLTDLIALGALAGLAEGPRAKLAGEIATTPTENIDDRLQATDILLRSQVGGSPSQVLAQVIGQAGAEFEQSEIEKRWVLTRGLELADFPDPLSQTVFSQAAQLASAAYQDPATKLAVSSALLDALAATERPGPAVFAAAGQANYANLPLVDRPLLLTGLSAAMGKVAELVKDDKLVPGLLAELEAAKDETAVNQTLERLAKLDGQVYFSLVGSNGPAPNCEVGDDQVTVGDFTLERSSS
ncbi:MAG: hypothetical protein KC910_14550 [Candidatus Eremiobacteraeota bacterium]|nr:hypothetical protein [Candidatus Eremiobacteraeota bacterium]